MSPTDTTPDESPVRTGPRAGPVHGPRARRLPADPGGGGRLGLGFWAAGEFVIVGARLVNLNQDGILAIAEAAIPRDLRAWIHLEEATAIRPARATVLGATWLRHRRCALRLVLDEDCPAGIYEALVACLPRPGRGDRPRHGLDAGDRAADGPEPAMRRRVDGGPMGRGFPGTTRPTETANVFRARGTEPVGHPRSGG